MHFVYLLLVTFVFSVLKVSELTSSNKIIAMNSFEFSSGFYVAIKSQSGIIVEIASFS